MLLNGNTEAAGRGRARPALSGSGAFRRLAGLALAGSLVALLIGFLVFAETVAATRPPADPHADAIVALTGGPQRIDDAVALLSQGAAERLLISGVYERTSGEALARRSPALRRFLDCCVDIGYEAQDTHGNAAETRDWALGRGYASLIVVTAAYHMPRSLAEIGKVLPGVTLVPYPVNPESRDLSRWARDPGLLRILVLEYMKYLVARLA